MKSDVSWPSAKQSVYIIRYKEKKVIVMVKENIKKKTIKNGM